jgi:hypothetical protein
LSISLQIIYLFAMLHTLTIFATLAGGVVAQNCYCQFQPPPAPTPDPK